MGAPGAPRFAPPGTCRGRGGDVRVSPITRPDHTRGAFDNFISPACPNDDCRMQMLCLPLRPRSRGPSGACTPGPPHPRPLQNPNRETETRAPRWRSSRAAGPACSGGTDGRTDAREEPNVLGGSVTGRVRLEGQLHRGPVGSIVGARVSPFPKQLSCSLVNPQSPARPSGSAAHPWALAAFASALPLCSSPHTNVGLVQTQRRRAGCR